MGCIDSANRISHFGIRSFFDWHIVQTAWARENPEIKAAAATFRCTFPKTMFPWEKIARNGKVAGGEL
jgi:hypothetical protein